MTRNKTVFAALAAYLSLTGCGGGLTTGPSALTGGVWKLQSIETLSAGLVGISRPDNYTVEFVDPTRVSVRADCNVCSGTYSLSGAGLTIGPLACTRAFCGATSQDTAFLEVLSSATTAGLRGIELSIDSPKGTLRFVH